MKIKVIIFLSILFFIILFLGRGLNPFSPAMFEGHDATQAARVQEFSLNLKSLQFPPRMSPNLAFKMSYPVFNFYAPFSYWITSLINIIGLDTMSSLKLSFLFALILAFLSSYFFLRIFFSFYSSLFGGVLYVSSLYFAIDIFVRGNLAETWFLALLPLVLALIYKNSKPNRLIFILTTLTLWAIITVHNLLSIMFLFILFPYIFLCPNKKINFLALVLALLLSAYFLIPLIFESSLTYANELTKNTNYRLHFLCLNQLWQSPWSFGGSIEGCLDTMPFKIGKPQLVFFTAGVLMFIWNIFVKKNNKCLMLPFFFFILTLLSLFLTTYSSKFVWELFDNLSSLIQFPWRFIAFTLIGIAFFSAYFLEKIKLPFKSIFALIILFIVLNNHSNYFYREPQKKEDFIRDHLTKDYIENFVVYQIPEYLPRTADYDHWQKLKTKTPTNNKQKVLLDQPFEKIFDASNTALFKPNILYFPYWKIYIDDKEYKPIEFDLLGRPIIKLTKKSTIKVKYQQTTLENLGNILSIIGFLTLIFIFKSNYFLSKKS